MLSTLIFQRLMDTWLTAEDPSPEALFGAVEHYANVRCWFYEIDITGSEPGNWVQTTKKVSPYARKHFYKKQHFDGVRVFESSNPEFVQRYLIPQYTRAAARRQPVIDKVCTSVDGFAIQFDRIVLPDKTGKPPAWLLCFRYVSFLAKMSENEVEFDHVDESIVTLCCLGGTAREIAAELNISPRTVEHRLERLKKKTGSKTLAGLVSYFLCTISPFSSSTVNMYTETDP